jgi:cytochrome c oxidase subunit 3/cytochrome o ubiquinol oxidase subunit 3
MNSTAAPESHPGELPDHRKLAIWIFLASDVIFFGALIAAFVVYRTRSVTGPGPAEVLTLFHATLMTMVLLVSSVTMVLALTAIRGGNRTRLWRWLLATAALGLFFLGLKAQEYSTLFSLGVTPSTNIFGSVYFTLTGFHALHVIIGIIWILAVSGKALRGGFSQTNYLPVEMVGLYWHFVDMIWVAVFMVVYLMEKLPFM